MLKIDIVTIFPAYFDSVFRVGLLGKALARDLFRISVHDLRAWATGAHREVDDEPFGGGAGMVMKPEPFFNAVEALAQPGTRVILLTPAGRRMDQEMVGHFAAQEHLILLCGRYEGVDERVAEYLATDEVSLGDYILGGGEAAACVVVEAVARLVPGAVGEPSSLDGESFSDGLLDSPQYTRPAEFRGLRVPETLRSGDHARVAAWRRRESLRRTMRRRPDLAQGAVFSAMDEELLKQIQSDEK